MVCTQTLDCIQNRINAGSRIAGALADFVRNYLRAYAMCYA